MNEAQARQAGYQFTGIYERSKEPVKEQLAEIRKQGFKAVFVIVPDSKYSRGPKGTGYSVYAEEKYFLTRQVEELQQTLGCIESRKAFALKKYNEEIDKIEEERRSFEERLARLKTKLGS